VKIILNREQKRMLIHCCNNGKVGYCTEVNDPNMLGMVDLGLFDGPIGVGIVGAGCGVFHLTETGRETIKCAE